MPRFTAVFQARDWEATEIASLLNTQCILETHASIALRWRDTESKDLQEELTSSHGWPEGTVDHHAGDGGSSISVTFTATAVPGPLVQAQKEGRAVEVDLDD